MPGPAAGSAVITSWPADFDAAYRAVLLAMDGEAPAVFPISGRTVTFTNKNNALPDNQLTDVFSYLEERYAQLGLDTWRQSFSWRGMPQTNLVAVVPGTNSRLAPLLVADHVDTALDEDLGKKIPELEEAGYPWADLLLMRAFDNHYQGFHARNLVEQWNATYENPTFRLATAEEFFDHMLALHGPEAFPTFRGDFGAAWSASHANTPHTEALVREAHRNGRSAEALLAAGSAIDRAPVPRSDLDRMFRMMLQVDEHSGAGGWPGYFTPEEMDRNNTIHLSYAQEAASLASYLHVHGLDRALAELPASGDAIAVVNPLGRERTGYARSTLPPEIYGTTFRVVERGTGNEIPYQRFDATSEILFLAEAVPPFGYRVYDLLPGAPSAAPDGMLEATATTPRKRHVPRDDRSRRRRRDEPLRQGPRRRDGRRLVGLRLQRARDRDQEPDRIIPSAQVFLQ